MIYLDVQTHAAADVKSPSNTSAIAEEIPRPAEKKSSGKTYCPYCNRESVLIWVHGHYQCSRCKYVVASGCESN
jgi:ribosomal protein L37AE/L43A